MNYLRLKPSLLFASASLLAAATMGCGGSGGTDDSAPTGSITPVFLQINADPESKCNVRTDPFVSSSPIAGELSGEETSMSAVLDQDSPRFFRSFNISLNLPKSIYLSQSVTLDTDPSSGNWISFEEGPSRLGIWMSTSGEIKIAPAGPGLVTLTLSGVEMQADRSVSENPAVGRFKFNGTVQVSFRH